MHAFASGRNIVSRRACWHGGFTLIELIAVITIIGVLAAVAVPTLGNLGDNRAALAAKVLLSDVTYAQQYAIATGRSAWVIFDLDAESWTLLVDDPTEPGPIDGIMLEDPADGGDFVQLINTGSYAGVAITAASFDGQPIVGFNWLGQPLNSDVDPLSAAGTLTLTSGHLLTITPSTGHIALIEP